MWKSQRHHLNWFSDGLNIFIYTPCLRPSEKSIASNNKFPYNAASSFRKGGWVVEVARLESVYTWIAYRGFESLPFRHKFKKQTVLYSLLFVYPHFNQLTQSSNLRQYKEGRQDKPTIWQSVNLYINFKIQKIQPFAHIQRKSFSSCKMLNNQSRLSSIV